MKRTRFIAGIAAALVAGLVLGGIGVSAASTRTATPVSPAAPTRREASSVPSVAAPDPSQMAITLAAPSAPQIAAGTPTPRTPDTTVRNAYCAPQRATTTPRSGYRDCNRYSDGMNGNSRCGW